MELSAINIIYTLVLKATGPYDNQKVRLKVIQLTANLQINLQSNLYVSLHA